MPQSPPYTIPFGPIVPVRVGIGPVTPKIAFRGASPPTNIAWYDENGLQAHVATVSSNNGSTLVISAAAAPGGTQTYDLTGDGSQCIPVAVILP
jgi:hypothetical protein